MSWRSHKDVIYEKGLQQLYFVHELRQFRVDEDKLILLCCSFVENILTFGFTAWHFHYQ